MPSHRAERRTAREWVKDDLKGMNGRREITATLRAHPVLLLQGLLRLVLSLGVVVGGLWLFGAIDQFGDWWWLSGVYAGLWLGGEISRLQKPAPEVG